MTQLQQLSPRGEELVQIAAELFSARGYEATSLQDIASVAGIRKASVYAHFERKEDLLRIILDEFTDRALGEVTAIAASNAPAGDKLRLIIRDLFASIDDYRSHVSVFLQELRYLETPQFATTRAKRDQYERVVVSILDQGVKSGELRPLPSKIVTYLLIGMMTWAYRWYEPGGELDVDALTDLAADIFLRGIATD